MCSTPPELSMYTKALMIASFFHDGVFDKGGRPYIEHPISVAMELDFDDERAIAVLHDIVEDTNVTLDDLLDMGKNWGWDGIEFPQYVVDGVDGLTRRIYEDGTKEPYMEFIARCCENDLSRKIKRKDIGHNMSSDRQYYLTDKFRAKLQKKYTEAIEFIDNYESKLN